jgi:predicted amidohydrolase
MTAGYWAAIVQARVDIITDPAKRDEVLAENRSRAIRHMEHILATVATPPRLFQYPVLMLQGGYRDRDEDARYAVSLELPGPDIEPLVEFCAKHNVYMSSSAVERRKEVPGWFFHSGFILGPNGLVIRYPKAQARSAPGVKIIWSVYDEYTRIYGKESVFPVVETGIGKLAVSVESEISVPEVSRAFAEQGVDVLCHPTVEFLPADRWIYDQLKAVRAYENRMYVVSANVGLRREIDPRTGEIVDERTRGGSSVHGPDGQMLAQIVGDGEGVALAYIDLDGLRERRKTPHPHIGYNKVLYQDVYRLNG